MGLRDRIRRQPNRSGAGRQAQSSDFDHLEEWAGSRRGVEGFVEPETSTTATTLVLVATDGEWTRRRVPSAKWVHDWANKLGIPTYDAAVVGVPQRMRDWNRRQKDKPAT